MPDTKTVPQNEVDKSKTFDNLDNDVNSQVSPTDAAITNDTPPTNEDASNEQPTDNVDPINDTTPPNVQEPAELVEGSIVSIDNIEYTIDANGNAIDKDNVIIRTKAELDIELSVGSIPANVDNTVDVNIAKLNELSGYDVAIDGTPATFTPEYIAQREAEIVITAKAEAKEEALKEYFNDNPDIANIANYKTKFGSIESYGNELDFSAISIDTLDNNQKLTIIIEAEMAKGNSQERATRIAKLSQAENTIDVDSTESLEYLTTKQNERLAIEQQERATAEQANTNAMNAELGVSFDDKGVFTVLDVKDSLYDNIINKGVLAGLKIPKSGVVIQTDNGRKQISRNELFNYVAKPVQVIDGQYYSKAELDLVEKLKDRDYRSLMALYAVNGIDSLIKEQSKKAIVKIVKAAAKDDARSNSITNTTTGDKPTFSNLL